MSNIGSFFNLGSQTTFVNESKKTLTFQVSTSQDISDNKIVFPPNQGQSGYVLSTDGTGTTSWVAPSDDSTNPVGPTNAIQFKGGNSEFSGVSNLTFDSTTNVLGVSGDISTNTLNVDGDSTLGGNLTVSANSNLTAVDIASTLNVHGNSTLGGTLTVNADSTLNNVSISKGTDESNATLTLDNSSSLIMTPRVFDDINDFSGQNLQPASSILIFDYNSSESVDCSLNSGNTPIQGQHLSIFYLNRNATPGNLRIDFGENNIVAGSGANRYLTFNSFGQSAELLAYGNNDNVDNNNNYLVFNTGATLERDTLP